VEVDETIAEDDTVELARSDVVTGATSVNEAVDDETVVVGISVNDRVKAIVDEATAFGVEVAIVEDDEIEVVAMLDTAAVADSARVVDSAATVDSAGVADSGKVVDSAEEIDPRTVVDVAATAATLVVAVPRLT